MEGHRTQEEVDEEGQTTGEDQSGETSGLEGRSLISDMRLKEKNMSQ